MANKHRLKQFAANHPLIGPAFWVVSVQYLAIQTVTANAARKYSFVNDSISDLGNTVCGNFDGHFICSPLHNLMNVSFFSLGVCAAIGSILLYVRFQESSATKAGFAAMAMSGLGMMVVGLAPENVDAWQHVVGAGLALTGGVASMIILGKSLGLPKYIRVYAIVFGYISLLAMIALAFIDFDSNFPGMGSIERLAALPQVLWLIILGFYMLYIDLRQTRQQAGTQQFGP